MSLRGPFQSSATKALPHEISAASVGQVVCGVGYTEGEIVIVCHYRAVSPSIAERRALVREANGRRKFEGGELLKQTFDCFSSPSTPPSFSFPAPHPICAPLFKLHHQQPRFHGATKEREGEREKEKQRFEPSADQWERERGRI